MILKIGLAITFSPTGKALLKETLRLQNLFNSQLVLIHIGEKNKEAEERLFSAIENSGIEKNSYEVIWDKGDPASAILRNSKKSKVDLLISGALEKESLFKFYFGSVARTIMREFTSSTLILKSPSENPQGFKKFYVSADYSPQGEKTILTAYQFAIKENAKEFVIIRDFHAPGLTASIIDGGSTNEINSLKQQWIDEEQTKMNFFIKELNLKEIEPKIVCLYGKEGWEAGNYASQNNADIFVISSPAKKMKLLDRLFMHNAEYSFDKLPSNLLIIR
ncbi:MAG: universal stress protein [Ignavibacteriae bacterium]|nr:universal stress protein [Ignavibacteriota bacterium]